MIKNLKPSKEKLFLTLIIIVLTLSFYYSSGLFDRPCNELTSRPIYQQNYLPTNLPESQNYIKNPSYQFKNININQNNLPKPSGSSGYEPSIFYTLIDINTYIKPFKNAISPCPLPFSSMDESANIDSVILFIDVLKVIIRLGVIFLYITAFYLLSSLLIKLNKKFHTKKVKKKKS